MIPPESCPRPVLVGSFDDHINNTEEFNDGKVENSFVGEEMTFLPSNESTETTGPNRGTT